MMILTQVGVGWNTGSTKPDCGAGWNYRYGKSLAEWNKISPHSDNTDEMHSIKLEHTSGIFSSWFSLLVRMLKGAVLFFFCNPCNDNNNFCLFSHNSNGGQAMSTHVTTWWQYWHQEPQYLDNLLLSPRVDYSGHWPDSVISPIDRLEFWNQHSATDGFSSYLLITVECIE